VGDRSPGRRGRLRGPLAERAIALMHEAPRGAIDQLDQPLAADVAVPRRHGNAEGMRAVVNAGRDQIRARTIGQGASDFAAVNEHDRQPLYGAVFPGQPAEDLTRLLLLAVDAPSDLA